MRRLPDALRGQQRLDLGTVGMTLEKNGEIVATGTPDEIRNNARVKEAYLGEEVTV